MLFPESDAGVPLTWGGRGSPIEALIPGNRNHREHVATLFRTKETQDFDEEHGRNRTSAVQCLAKKMPNW